MKINIIIGVSAIVAIAKLARGPPTPSRRVVSKKSEADARKALASWDLSATEDVDAEEENPDPDHVVVRFMTRGREVVRSAGATARQLSDARIVREAAAAVRADVGLLTRTAANALVARREVSKFMEKRKVRPTHQMALVPYAVELCFLPTKDDVAARDWAASQSWCDRREDYAAVRVGAGRESATGRMLRGLPIVGGVAAALFPAPLREVHPPSG